MATYATGKEPNGVSAKPVRDEHLGNYDILERPYGTKKNLRIVILGAGVSGLSLFKQAEDNLENVEIVCYEKNDDIGGTVGSKTPDCCIHHF